MKKMRSHIPALLVLLAISSGALAGEDDPYIGYVYPAGGQQGATFEVLLGGNNLEGACAARISGVGGRAEVVEHVRPLSQGQFKEMQNLMGELRKKKRAAAPGEQRRGRHRRSQTSTNSDWTAEDEKALSDMRKRLSTFSIRRSSVPPLVETVRLRVTLDSDAAPGERELRLQAANGLSNPLLFCIGQLPEVTEESARSIATRESERRGQRGRKRQTNARADPGTTPLYNEPEVERGIVPPTIINGQVLPGDVDRYRFEARKGQQLVVAVSARQLIPYLSDTVPGWFQATVSLSDAHGNEVAYSDDFRFHPDPALHCEIPEDGTYVVEIRDALYRGREDFVYRMALGELPLITSVFPLGGRSGERNVVALRGWNLPKAELTVPDKGPQKHWVSTHKGDLLSNRVPFEIGTLPEYRDAEPNGGKDSPQRVEFPCVVNGRIDHPGDADFFSFEAGSGTHLVAEVRARRLGSSLDSYLRLANAQGVVLGYNDDHEDKGAGLTTHHADSRLIVRIPESGVYVLSLEDTQRGGGWDYGYRLRIDKPRPDFDLRVAPSSVNARAGTNVTITAHALRKDGFAGEIALRLKGAPAGFGLCGARVPAGQDKARFTLTAPPNPLDRPVCLALEGVAEIEGREVCRQVAPADQMTQAFVYQHLVPARGLQVAVLGPARRLRMAIAAAAPLRIPLGGMVEAPVTVLGRLPFGAVQFELSDPPEGVSLKEGSGSVRSRQLVFRSDAAVSEAGLKGNLIVNAFAVKQGKTAGKGKEQRKKRRVLLGALPAIPFEIVEDQRVMRQVTAN